MSHIKLKKLLLENLEPVSDLPKIELMSPEEFERSGGYNVGIGAQGKLYTLRSDENQQGAFYSGEGMPPEIRHWRSSQYHHNLGKDWNEVVERLPEIFKRKGYGSDKIVKLYVPGFANGKLDPNNPPVTYVPSDKMEFGKYVGRKIEDLKKDPDGLKYLLYLATSYEPSPKTNRQRYAFMQHLKDFIQPELDDYIKRKGEEKKKQNDEAQIRIERYKPLADFLKSMTNSGFAQSIAQSLEVGNEPRGRAVDIVQDIWAKSYGRRNSKPYNDAHEDFTKRFVEPDPKRWGYDQ